jgi:hypothetical protein
MRCPTIVGLALVGSLVATAPMRAQANAGQPRPRAALLQDINRMFLNQVVREMALSPDQVPRFERVVSMWAQKRNTLEAEERRLRQALAGEQRPGVAANQDSVSRFVDALNDIRVDYASTFRDEMRELTPILSPVQRGQFQIARDRFLQKVKDLQQQRPGAGGPLRPQL